MICPQIILTLMANSQTQPLEDPTATRVWWGDQLPATAGWFTREETVKMDDDWGSTIYGNHHIHSSISFFFYYVLLYCLWDNKKELIPNVGINYYKQIIR